MDKPHVLFHYQLINYYQLNLNMMEQWMKYFLLKYWEMEIRLNINSKNRCFHIRGGIWYLKECGMEEKPFYIKII